MERQGNASDIGEETIDFSPEWFATIYLGGILLTFKPPAYVWNVYGNTVQEKGVQYHQELSL